PSPAAPPVHRSLPPRSPLPRSPPPVAPRLRSPSSTSRGPPSLPCPSPAACCVPTATVAHRHCCPPPPLLLPFECRPPPLRLSATRRGSFLLPEALSSPSEGAGPRREDWAPTVRWYDTSPA